MPVGPLLCSGLQPGGCLCGGCSPCPPGWALALGTHCPAQLRRSSSVLADGVLSQPGPRGGPRPPAVVLAVTAGATPAFHPKAVELEAMAWKPVMVPTGPTDLYDRPAGHA